MERFGIRRLGALLSVVLVFGLLAAGFSMARAQQSDPTVDGPGTPRPGHIHAGSCANLGDVVYALSNATIDNLPADYQSTGDVNFVGSQNVLPVYASETTLDVSLDEILSADHAINFHLSGDEIGTYIACGDIGGFVRDGVLYVGLAPATGDNGYDGSSQFAGTAVLTDNGDNTTSVVVQLVELPVASGSTTTTTTTGAATPVSTPVVTVPNESAAPSASAEASVAPSAAESSSPSADASASASASASADESAAPSADESAAASVDASVSESVAPVESPSSEPSPSV